MTMCNCVVQAGQITSETQADLRAKLDAFSQANFGSAADIRWTEIAKGSGYTAFKPSTSSLVSVIADRPVEQSERVAMLQELCALWTNETDCTLDEVVGVITDPLPN